MKSYLKIDHVGKTFVRGGRHSEVLNDVTLGIEQGQPPCERAHQPAEPRAPGLPLAAFEHLCLQRLASLAMSYSMGAGG